LKKEQYQNVRARWKSDEYKHGIGLEALLADAAGHSSNNMTTITATAASIQNRHSMKP